ncbi:hypothetical protein QQ045_007385 [Rhodiola kirilowii]
MAVAGGENVPAFSVNDSMEYLISTSSKQLSQFRSDVSNECEEAYWDEDGEEIYTEFPCPYCNDDFDLVELCCHIEDVHFGQAKTGVCPVCAVGVDSSMVAHLTKKHGKMIKISFIHKLKLLKGKPDANLPLLLKEFHEEYLKSLIDGSSTVPPPSAMEPDPLLSSFFYNVPPVVQRESLQLSGSSEPCIAENSLHVNTVERKVSPPLSDKEHEEKAQRSEFVQGLVWSTFFDDNL